MASFTAAVAIAACLVSVSGRVSAVSRSCEATGSEPPDYNFHFDGNRTTLTNKYGRMADALAAYAWPVRNNLVLESRKAIHDVSLSTACREALFRISHDMFNQKPWAMKGQLLI